MSETLFSIQTKRETNNNLYDQARKKRDPSETAAEGSYSTECMYDMVGIHRQIMNARR